MVEWYVFFIGITTCSKGSVEHTLQHGLNPESSEEPLEGLKQGSNVPWHMFGE